MNQNFSERIRIEKERMGLSSSSIARKLGIGKSSQSQIESGITKPKLSYLFELALLGMDVKYIVTGKRDVSNPQAEALANAFFSADEPTKQVICKILNIDLTNINQNQEETNDD